MRTVGAEINLPKEKIFLQCAGEKLEFNSAKFTDKHFARDPIVPDQIETLAHVAVASSDAVERYLLEQDKLFTEKERKIVEDRII